MRAITLMIVLLASSAALLSGCAHQTVTDQEKKGDSEKLQRAWDCEPYRQGTLNPFRLSLSFANPYCNPPNMLKEEQESLFQTLRDEYGSNASRFDALANLKYRMSGGNRVPVLSAKQRAAQMAEAKRIEEAEEAEAKRIEEYQKSPEYQQELREQHAQEQRRLADDVRQEEQLKRGTAIAKAKEERERIALEDRKRKVKSGEVKAADFAEAELVYAPTESINNIMLSPLLEPDRGHYSGAVILEAQQSAGLLRGRWDNSEALRTLQALQLLNTNPLIGMLSGANNPNLLSEAMKPHYVFLRISPKTINYAPAKMRIGATIKVLGQYVDNMKYKTVIGGQETAPLIEVMYIGE